MRGHLLPKNSESVQEIHVAVQPFLRSTQAGPYDEVVERTCDINTFFYFFYKRLGLFAVVDIQDGS